MQRVLKSLFGELVEENKILKNYDCVASFRFSSSAEAMLACSISSSTLAKLANGIVKNEDEPIKSAEEAIQETKNIISQKERKKNSEFKEIGENRTPFLWGKRCEKTLKKVHPDYEENVFYKKSTRYFEYTRIDSSGLIISQNFLRTDEKTYEHGFSLMFTSNGSIMSNDTPLYAGSRFSKSILWLICDDLKLWRGCPEWPENIHSTYNWGANTFELMERSVQISEQYLLPFYRSQIVKKSKLLGQLFQFIQSTFETLDMDAIFSEPLNYEDEFFRHYAKQKRLIGTNYEEWGDRCQKQYMLLSALNKQGKMLECSLAKDIFIKATEISEEVSFFDVLVTYAYEFFLIKDEISCIIKLTEELQAKSNTEFSEVKGSFLKGLADKILKTLK